MTDEELLREASRGVEAAFLELYERHKDAVFRFAFRLLGSVELAEDVAHDCFLSLIKHPHRFDASRASLRTYLYAAARNLAMKHSGARDIWLRLTICSQSRPRPTASSRFIECLMKISALVQRAVASLPPLQREALVLFEYEELPLSEISKIVGADVGTVKARLYRARQALKKSLSEHFTEQAQEARVLEEAFK
jgi:RNA polymerase sigma-70 factor (ECF subfamily)